MTDERLENLREALKSGDDDEVIRIVHNHHPADIADHLEFLTTAELHRFTEITDDLHLVAILEELDDFAQANVAQVIKRRRLAQSIEELSPDEAADLLMSIDEGTADSMLDAMESVDADSVRELMQYPPDTAGGLMTYEYMSLRANMTVGEALQEVREFSHGQVETIYYLYVCDQDNRLVGVLSLRELLASDDNKLISDIMDIDVIYVTADEDQEDVADTLERYGFLALPVVRNENLVGIVTFDDVIPTIEEETTEDIFRQSGMSTISDVEMMRSERIIQAPFIQILGIRMPWLLVVLVGGLIAGGVMGRYEDMLEQIVILAFFVPVIMDMGGNVGTQASTIFVRGLVLGHIEPDKVYYYIMREAATGFTIGSVTGLGAAIFATLWQQDPLVGLVIFIAMTLTCTLASIVGFGVPWIIHKLGADPAAASNPFITTVKDITGLAIYFTTASLLLTHLL